MSTFSPTGSSQGHHFRCGDRGHQDEPVSQLWRPQVLWLILRIRRPARPSVPCAVTIPTHDKCWESMHLIVPGPHIFLEPTALLSFVPRRKMEVLEVQRPNGKRWKKSVSGLQDERHPPDMPTPLSKSWGQNPTLWVTDLKCFSFFHFLIFFFIFCVCLKRSPLSRRISKTVRDRDKISITGIGKSQAPSFFPLAPP